MNKNVSNGDRGLLTDLLAAVKDAAEGQLTPYSQRMLKQMSEEAKADNSYPAYADEVWQLLHKVLAEVPQTSDEELERASIENDGGRLLYAYPTEDPFTRLYLMQTKQKLYRISIYIDKLAAADDISAYARAMQTHLRAWMKQQGYVEKDVQTTVEMMDSRFVAFETIEAAASAALFVLEKPERLTIC